MFGGNKMHIHILINNKLALLSIVVCMHNGAVMEIT